MPSQDTSKIKDDILNFLESKGPSLPIHIAQEIRLSPLFTSAFLSELFSEKRIKMSHLRVGSSPVYFLPHQEEGLEKFSGYLKNKEKEAFSIIKREKILRDDEQEPAIRVALRAIKDFAFLFEKEGTLYWRYFLFNEEEKAKVESPAEEQIKKEPEIKKLKKREKKIASKGKEKSKKNEDKFLLKVKEFLSKEKIELIDIESFSKERLILRVKTNDEELAFIAYNKKKIEEKDLAKASKKAEELGLKYIVLSLGEPSKRLNETIEAVKNLSGIKRIE